MAIIGLLSAGRTLKLGWWGLLPLGLLFVNPTVLRYVSEVKPYALDLGLAAVFIAWGLRKKVPNWPIALAGVFGIWASLPLIFVLASVGTYRFIPLLFNPSQRIPQPYGTLASSRALLPWLLTGGGWLLSFTLLYLLVLAPSVGSKYLNVYHGNYFFPLPGDDDFWTISLGLLSTFPKLAFGYTVLAIAAGWCVGLSVIFLRKTSWLLLPTGLVMLASVFGFYSLLPRLLLFTLPCWWLLAAWATSLISEKFSGWPSWLLVGLWLLVAGGTNVVQHFITPQTFSDSRRLVRQTEPGYTPILHHGAVPAFDYYSRIHPLGSAQNTIQAEARIQDASLPGKYVLLYDVTTQGNIRESARHDSIWAAARGCKVRPAVMFRAKALYVDCPGE